MSYIEELQSAELHWHFEQANQALASGLLIPAVITYLAAIENSMRSTMWQLKNEGYPEDCDLGSTLSNRLLREAKAIGMPIELLAMDGEDILNDMTSNKPDVGIVRVRHNLCHGNVQQYMDKELGIFTPECLRNVSDQIDIIARRWVTGLSQYRRRTIKNI